jgi:hypothetical protein
MKPLLRALGGVFLGMAVASLVAQNEPPPEQSAPRPKKLPTLELREVPLMQFRGANSPAPGQPGETDCNSPLHWDRDTLFLFNSAGQPWRSSGSDLFDLSRSYIRSEYNTKANGGRWIECTWKADDGMLYGWYHHEPSGVCPEKPLTAPVIGAVRSTDNGANWQDLGVIIEAPVGTLFCDTKNRYFAGGNGDFCVMLDRRSSVLYLFFSTYGGDLAEQGVAVARMNWSDRNVPVGRVWKWHRGNWSEPGLGGRATPFLKAEVDWAAEDATAFWGPSVHWNSHLKQYVMLLNRARDFAWTQEGVYVAFSTRLADPRKWSAPEKILDGLRADEWYPQVVGLDAAAAETDKLAGKKARLFVRGASRWEIEFRRYNEKD